MTIHLSGWFLGLIIAVCLVELIDRIRVECFKNRLEEESLWREMKSRGK